MGIWIWNFDLNDGLSFPFTAIFPREVYLARNSSYLDEHPNSDH